MTMSLLLASDGTHGVLTTSHYPAVGAVVPHVSPAAAAASQAVGDPAIAALLATADPDHDLRQLVEQAHPGGPRQLARVAALPGSEPHAWVHSDVDCLEHVFEHAMVTEHAAVALVGNCLAEQAGPMGWQVLGELAHTARPGGGAMAVTRGLLAATARAVIDGGGDRRGPLAARLVVHHGDRVAVDVRIDPLLDGRSMLGGLATAALQQLAAAEAFEARPGTHQPGPTSLQLADPNGPLGNAGPRWEELGWDDLHAMHLLALHGPGPDLEQDLDERGLGHLGAYLQALANSQWWGSLGR